MFFLFILIGAPIATAAFGLIPLASLLPLFSACTISMLLAMAFWRTPVVALMPDITPSQFRSQANGIINFMGGVGAKIATLGGAALYKMNQAYPFWLGSVLVIGSTLLVFLFIKEPTVCWRCSFCQRMFYWFSLPDARFRGCPGDRPDPDDRRSLLGVDQRQFTADGGDITDDAHVGTYTGLYYLFSTLAAIAGPNINGWIIALTRNNFNLVMLVGPVFMALAFLMMVGVRRGEARTRPGNQESIVTTV